MQTLPPVKRYKMSIEVISIGSSSSGNSYIIKAGGRVILLDVGLTAKKITGALSDAGFSPEDVEAVLVTHEHTDHVKSVRAISRKCSRAVFYATHGTVLGTEKFAYVPDERLRIVRAGDTLLLGSLDGDGGAGSKLPVRIGVFALSHDAREPVGYSVSCGGDKLAVVTDTGVITDEIYDAVRDAGKIVFESNHDEGLLMYGEYPYHVKVRIKSDHGHLSNKYAGEMLARILEDRSRASGSPGSAERGEACTRPLEIMLAHLSFHNNAPYYARNTIVPILKENGFERDTDYTLTIAAKDELTIF